MNPVSVANRDNERISADKAITFSGTIPIGVSRAIRAMSLVPIPEIEMGSSVISPVIVTDIDKYNIEIFIPNPLAKKYICK